MRQFKEEKWKNIYFKFLSTGYHACNAMILKRKKKKKTIFEIFLLQAVKVDGSYHG